jgi:hypothetical protein
MEGQRQVKEVDDDGGRIATFSQTRAPLSAYRTTALITQSHYPDVDARSLSLQRVLLSKASLQRHRVVT